MLGVIDRGRRVRWRRPPKAGGRCRLGAARKLGKIWKPAFGRSDNLEGVEGGYPLPRLVEIDPRVREDYPALCGARRQRQGKTFTLVLSQNLSGGVGLGYDGWNRAGGIAR